MTPNMAAWLMRLCNKQLVEVYAAALWLIYLHKHNAKHKLAGICHSYVPSISVQGLLKKIINNLFLGKATKHLTCFGSMPLA